MLTPCTGGWPATKARPLTMTNGWKLAKDGFTSGRTTSNSITRASILIETCEIWGGSPFLTEGRALRSGIYGTFLSVPTLRTARQDSTIEATDCSMSASVVAKLMMESRITH